jgi:hypothetical protein
MRKRKEKSAVGGFCFNGKTVREMDFFEMHLVSFMPVEIYREIKERLSLALTYLEDGAVNTAKDILRRMVEND